MSGAFHETVGHDCNFGGAVIFMDRRSFLKATALVGSRYLAGAAGLASLAGCSPESEWQPVHYPKVLLKNFSLFDGVANHLQRDKIILIEGQRILAVENRGDLSQYSGFRQFDMSGLTVLPGLIDNHVHMTFPFMGGENRNILHQKNDQFDTPVYIDEGSGRFIFEQIGENRTRLSYRLYMDIGGWVPKSLVERSNSEGIVGLVADVIAEAQRRTSLPMPAESLTEG